MNVLHKFPATAIDQRDDFAYAPSSAIISGVWMAGELLITLSSGCITHTAIVSNTLIGNEYYMSAILFVSLACFLVAHYAGLYSFDAIMSPWLYLDKVIIASATVFLFLLAIAFSLKVSEEFSRIWMFSFAITACSVSMLLRFAGAQVLLRLSRVGIFVRKVAVFGAGKQGQRMLSHFNKSRPEFMKLVGLYDDRLQRIEGQVGGHPVLGDLDDLIRRVRANRIDDVIVALPWSAEDRLHAIVEKLRELPVNVHLGSDLIGFRLNCRRPPSHFDHVPVVEVGDKPLSGWDVVWKVLEDKVLAFFALLLLSPLMLLIAVAIKLESPGPVLFRQRRSGFNNNEFFIYKFRSMYVDQEDASRTIQAKPGDRRVTRIGRFIRRISIDELPQLLNVLGGSMSLVGPRPHAVDHNEEYSLKIRGYFARHRVKPGITGWAQIKGLRGETDTVDKMEARVRHDVYYAENWSLLFDLRILAITAYVVLWGKNAY